MIGTKKGEKRMKKTIKKILRLALICVIVCAGGLQLYRQMGRHAVEDREPKRRYAVSAFIREPFDHESFADLPGPEDHDPFHQGGDLHGPVG